MSRETQISRGISLEIDSEKEITLFFTSNTMTYIANDLSKRYSKSKYKDVFDFIELYYNEMKKSYYYMLDNNHSVVRLDVIKHVANNLIDTIAILDVNDFDQGKDDLMFKNNSFNKFKMYRNVYFKNEASFKK